MTHGGKRAGAGRPPKADKKRPISAKVSPEVEAYLREHGVSRTIEATIRRTEAFKDWSRKNDV